MLAIAVMYLGASVFEFYRHNALLGTAYAASTVFSFCLAKIT